MHEESYTHTYTARHTKPPTNEHAALGTAKCIKGRGGGALPCVEWWSAGNRCALPAAPALATCVYLVQHKVGTSHTHVYEGRQQPCISPRTGGIHLLESTTHSWQWPAPYNTHPQTCALPAHGRAATRPVSLYSCPQLGSTRTCGPTSSQYKMCVRLVVSNRTPSLPTCAGAM